MNVKELADGQFAVGQAVGDVTGYIAKITNPEMIAIQPENGMGKKITLFACEKGKGVGQSAHAGQLVTFVGLTARPAYVGQKPASAGGGSYTQNQFNFQSCFPAESAPASPGHPSQPPARANGNGKDEARIERQSARRDAVMLVAGIMKGAVMTRGDDAVAYDDLLDIGIRLTDKAYHSMLTLTGTEALPAPSLPTAAEQKASPANDPAKPAAPATDSSTLLPALQAGLKVLAMVKQDKAKARIAFLNLTGYDHHSDVKDMPAAQEVLRRVTEVEGWYNNCVAKDAFVEAMARPEADKDELERTLMGFGVDF